MSHAKNDVGEQTEAKQGINVVNLFILSKKLVLALRFFLLLFVVVVVVVTLTQ